MPFLKVKNDLNEKLELLAKQLKDKTANDLCNEAIVFYLMYLDFLGLEKNTTIVFNDLKTQEDKERASKDCDLLMFSIVKHFADKGFKSYLLAKKELGVMTADLSLFQE